MSKVFVSVSVSLDGYLVPPGMDLEHAFDASFQGWGAQWGKLQSWLLATRFFRTSIGLGEGGETGVDDDIAARTFQRTGVSILGNRMFAISPVMFGGGRRLFEGVGREVELELVETMASPRTTHVRYAVRARRG